MRLSDAIEYMDSGYTADETVEELVRKYGVSPLDVLEDMERRKETLENLQVIIDVLSDRQRAILLMTAKGMTIMEMAEQEGITFQGADKLRKGIPKALEKVADEKKIDELNEKLKAYYSKKITPTRQRKIDECLAELDHRMKVREALKNLFSMLTPLSSTKEMNGRVSTPIYPYEWEMLVGKGMEYKKCGADHVYQWVTKTACMMPEYMKQCFGKGDTCCMICATCRRSKDVSGRGTINGIKV